EDEREDQTSLREKAEFSLESLKSKHDRVSSPVEVDRFIADLRDSPDEGSRLEAIEELVRVRPATERIVDALGLALTRKGETQPVREAAAAALREIGSAVGPEHEHVSKYAISPVGIQTRPLEESRSSKFGTSGDRGIIGKDFDFPLIHKLAQGTALYAKENYPGKATLIGRDTRRMNAEFQRET
ncbi:MAG: hypothetical protein AAB065_03095, partial [Deltaproteobacteria bacterium]